MNEAVPNKKTCELIKQGYRPGSCLVATGNKRRLGCEATLRFRDGELQRLITSMHLSRPENYFSIYQSGCNFSCRKCHSWYFSKEATGQWLSPKDILQTAKNYEKQVTLMEPREHSTAWHAHESCHCCGACILTGERSPRCPGVLGAEDITISSQGFGPARNIVGFTGGDLTCRSDFYAHCARLIKENTSLWVLIETNGYGLTPENLDLLEESSADSFWLDIKAEDNERHRWLTGCDNQWILQLLAWTRSRASTLTSRTVTRAPMPTATSMALNPDAPAPITTTRPGGTPACPPRSTPMPPLGAIR